MVTEAIRTPGTPRRSRRGAAPWLLAVLTVALLAAAWWQSHPKAFDTATATAAVGVVGAGEAAHVDSGIYTSHAVTLSSVRPRVAPGSPDADITMTVCGPPRSSSAGVGFVRGDLDGYCGTASGVDGASLGMPNQQVVITIRTHEAGVVRVEGFDVRYRDGLQVGTQHTGSEITITVGD